MDNSFDKITHYGDNFFYYPINPLEFHFPDIKNYYGKKLINWKELVFRNNENWSYGINLYFEDDLNFTIHNQAYPIDANQYIFSNSLPINLIEK